MARSKKGSSILETARQRLAGLRSITPAPDFGPTLTLDDYQQDIEGMTSMLDAYNEALSNLDQLQNNLLAAEGRLRDKNRRMLVAAEARYGSDSNEYEQVGGTRRSERKRPGPKSKTTTPPAS